MSERRLPDTHRAAAIRQSSRLVYLICLVASAWFSGCPIVVGHGFIELDENTDPRIFKQTSDAKPIGMLETRGAQVYLNDRVVRGQAGVSSGDRVRTGPDSLAWIRFMGPLTDSCDSGIEIRELEYGKIYGKTSRCPASVYTVLGRAVADRQAAEYLVTVARGGAETEVTAVAGSVRVDGPAGRTVVLRARQAVTLRPTGMTAPRDLAPDEIDRRLSWVEVSVPRVVGGSIAEAQRALQERGLLSGRVTIRANDGRETPDDVAVQSPRPEQRVRRGSPVDLEVWGSIPEVAVPSVLSQPLEQALVELERQGLRRGAVSIRENNGRQKPGTIADQDPRPGQRVKLRSRVNLEQWGPLPVNVPQVVQRSLREARAILERSGLRVGSISGEQKPLDDDFVSAQSPAAGTSLPAGSPVDLRVTRPSIGVIRPERAPRATEVAPEPTPVPVR